MRKIKTIEEVEGELYDKVWYNRHMVLREKIEDSELWLVEDGNSARLGHDRVIERSIWEGALAAAQKMEKKYSIENLGPYCDFDWGMLNGKLSALRWILGEEWDNLDT